MSQGVIAGCDRHQEWMLPWWWSNYRKYHDLPVAFIDFGMTAQAKKWCEKRGRLIPLKAPKDFVFPRPLIASDLRKKWERRYGTYVWHARSRWFYKPFALLQTPFKESLWLDLDCEILGSLRHLFQKLHKRSRLALARDNTGSFEEVGYNSGVIVYENSSPLLSQWASLCLRQNDRFLADQEVLTYLIEKDDCEITELPWEYNWVIKKGVNAEAIVLHWSGQWGKQVIRNKLLHTS